MQQIPLTAIPSQSLSFNIGGAYWQISLYPAVTHMCADFSRDGSPLISGVRCFGGIPLLPYEYLYLPNFGNFVFDSDPDWQNFSGTCNLYYLDIAELATFNANILAK